MTRLTTSLAMGGTRALSIAGGFQGAPSAPPPLGGKAPLSPEDDLFLEELEQAAFRFFWEQASPHTGLVKDRCNVRGSDKTEVASIAATGFGLTAVCIGDKRGWVSPYEAHAHVLTALRFLWRTLPNHRGFFFHFADVNTGARLWDSEVSSIDTAILLCGVLTCRQHFPSMEIRRLALDIFNRVEWTWLAEDTPFFHSGGCLRLAFCLTAGKTIAS